MKKISNIFILFLLSMNASAAKPAYFPSELKQFQQSGKCIACDLSEAVFNWQQHNNSDLTNAILTRMQASYSSFYESNFTSAQMTEAHLIEFKASGSNFRNANLTGADLYSANLSSCDFSGANLIGVNLRRANLVRAVITKEQLSSAKSISCAILPDGSVHYEEGDRC